MLVTRNALNHIKRILSLFWWSLGNKYFMYIESALPIESKQHLWTNTIQLWTRTLTAKKKKLSFFRTSIRLFEKHTRSGFHKVRNVRGSFNMACIIFILNLDHLQMVLAVIHYTEYLHLGLQFRIFSRVKRMQQIYRSKDEGVWSSAQ